MIVFKSILTRFEALAIFDAGNNLYKIHGYNEQNLIFKWKFN